MNPLTAARMAGHTAEEVINFLQKVDPATSKKIKQALAMGYGAEEVMNFLGGVMDTEPKAQKAQKFKKYPSYAKAMSIMNERAPESVKQQRELRDRGALEDVLDPGQLLAGGAGALAGGPAGAAGGVAAYRDLKARYDKHVEEGGQLSFADFVKSAMKGVGIAAAGKALPGAVAGALGGEGEQPVPQQPVEPRAQAEEVPQPAQPAVEEPASELSPQDAFKALEERGLGNIMKSLGQQLDADSIRGAVANIKGKKFVSDLEKSMGTPAVEIFAKAKEFVGSPKEAQPVTEAKTPIRFKSKSDDQERWKWHSQKWGKDKESYEPISKHGQYEIWHRSQEKGRGGIGEIRAIDQDGNVVGLVSYDDAGKGKIEAAVEVDPKHRRKGIASKLYEESEKQSGKTLQPAEEQTPFSKALWEKEGKKFGREQKINLKEKGHSEFRPEVSFEKGNKDLSKYLSNIGTIQMPKDAKLSKDAKPLQALKSSNVRYADYDPENKTLQVLFAPTSGKSGEIYEYNDVPEEDVLGMMKGSGTAVTRGANSFRAWFGGKNPSIGRAFKDFIAKKDDKGDAVYPYRKISEKYVKDEDLKKIRGADTVHLATQYVDAFEDLTLQSQAKTRAEGLKKVSSALKEIDDSLLEDMIFQVTKAVGQEVKQAKRKGKQKRFKGGKESEIEKRVKEMAGVR